VGWKACRATGFESLLKGLPLWQDRNGSTTAIPLNSWLAAKLDGKAQTAEFFERRFRDEYRPAFAAWMKTDPFNNAQALPGPIFMPDYHNAKHEQFLGLTKQAAEMADHGTKSGETGDQYVRITVLLATVLLITAIGQRFRFKSVRVVFMILAWLLLCLPFWQLLLLPRVSP